MKLSNYDFYLDWPTSIDVINLRRFIIESIIKKGDVIRWSIIEIKDSENSYKEKQLRINAIFMI